MSEYGYIPQAPTQSWGSNKGIFTPNDIYDLIRLNKWSSAGSLELIQTQSYSTTVSAVDFTSIKEDLYDVHFLTIANSGHVTDNRRLTCRFFESGVLETSTVYEVATRVGDSANNWSDVQGTSENELRLGDNTGGNAAGEKSNSIVWFYNLGSSSKYSYLTFQNSTGDISQRLGMEFGAGCLKQTSLVDGIRILINDDSNFDSFDMSLYGVRFE